MRKFIASLLVCMLLSSQSALAINRVPWLVNMNPPSPWLNTYERDVRLGFGQLIYDLVGTTSGFYNNIIVTPSAGLSVSVGASSPTAQGSLYQYLADDQTPFGGFPDGVGSLALPADPTQIFVQGLTATSGYLLGPLTPPGSSGLTTDYLVEGQLVSLDTNSQTVSIIQPVTGITTNPPEPRDRVDYIVYETKAGTAAASGTQVAPAVDSGWVGIATVAVPNGTTVITSGMITPFPTYPGLAKASPYGVNAVVLSPTGTQPGYISVSGAGTFGGAITGTSGSFSGAVNAGSATIAGPVVINGGITLQNALTTIANANFTLDSGGGSSAVDINPIGGSTGGLAVYNGTSSGFGPLTAGTANFGGNISAPGIYAPNLYSNGSAPLGLSGNGNQVNIVGTNTSAGVTISNSTTGNIANFYSNGSTTPSTTISSTGISTQGLTLANGNQGSVGINGISLQTSLATAASINTNQALNIGGFACSLFGVALSGVERLCLDGSGNLSASGSLYTGAGTFKGLLWADSGVANSSGGSFLIGGTTGQHILMDSSNIESFNNASESLLNINPRGAEVLFGGEVSATAYVLANSTFGVDTNGNLTAGTLASNAVNGTSHYWSIGPAGGAQVAGLTLNNTSFGNGIITFQNGATLDEGYYNSNAFTIKASGGSSYQNFYAGSVYANGTTLTSDRNLKKNIDYHPNFGLATINKLKPVSFDWKSTGKHSQGFIAQDVEHVIPSAVSTDQRGLHYLDYNQIIPVLTKAIQEQQAEIVELKRELHKR